MSESTPFARYVAQARNGGGGGPWRIIAGFALMLTVAALIVAVVAVSVVLGLNIAASGRPPKMTAETLDAFFATRLGFFCLLLSFGGLTLGLWLAVRVLHRRRPRTLNGADGRISWRNFRTAAFVAMGAAALAEAATFLVAAEFHLNPNGFLVWLAWLAPLCGALFIQISAEELIFRGYVMQELAARFRSPWVWAVLPTATFAALHWNTDLTTAMNAANLAMVATFAAGALLLVYLTGDLGAAMGLHFGNNAFALLVIGHSEAMSGGALLTGRTIEAPGWRVDEAAWLGVTGVVAVALAVWALVHPRSPFCVRPLA